MVLVPLVNVVPVPLVAQFPLTVHDPDVSVIVSAPEVMVTSETVTVDAFAVSVPPEESVRVPLPESAKFAVVKAPVIKVAFDTSMAVDIVIVPETVRL
jgi:hypothetical protein